MGTQRCLQHKEPQHPNLWVRQSRGWCLNGTDRGRSWSPSRRLQPRTPWAWRCEPRSWWRLPRTWWCVIGGGVIGGGGGVIGGGGGSASCRRWCRTPQGQAYCCEGANEPISAAVTKQGQCPPVRPSCPPTRFGQPPRTCSSDGGCGGYDKCCFDTCLQHHTCKPPIGLGK